MEFLENNQIRAWAEEHGLQGDERLTVILPELPSRFRGTYASGRRSGQESFSAQQLVEHLGPWDECLVRITLWGVWRSSEDWPAFYAWRAAYAERRSLDVAPGHLFTRADDVTTLVELLTLIMENAWDADVLCSYQGRVDRLRGKISHDEWYEILEDTSDSETGG